MNDFVELRQVINKILQKWWLVVLITAGTGILGYLWSNSLTPVYEAKTTLIVGRTINSPELSRTDIDVSSEVARTYADIVRRYPVLQGTVEELGLSEGWKDLRKRVSVNLVNDTQLLEVAVEAESPEEAQLIADEISKQLILLSPTNLQEQETQGNLDFIQGRLDSLQSKINAGEERLRFLDAINISGASTEQILDLQNQINELERLIVDWESNYSALLSSVEVEQSANNLAVIEPAQASSSPVRPRILLNTLIATILGLILSIGTVFLLDFVDDTLKQSDDLHALLGIPSLGAISRINGKSLHDKLLTNQDPFSQAAEDYRLLRSKLQFMAQEGSKAFLITSPLPKEGRSTTVANLAVVMAQAGLRTIVVDADLRQPTLHHIFQIPNEGGLGQLLRYPDLKPSAYLKRNAHIPDLKILNSGALPPNTAQVLGGGLPPSPSELLGSQRMTRLLSELREMADVIIIDSPPAVSVADAAVLSNKVDGVLMVLDSNNSKRDTARQAVFNLQQARATILGAVFNQAAKQKFGFRKGSSAQTGVPQLPDSTAQNDRQPATAKL